MAETPPEIARKIRLARERRATKLDLSDHINWENNLREIPGEVFELDHLEELTVHGDFENIPIEIGRLENLLSLDVYSPVLTGFPDVASRMTKLEKLRVSGSRLGNLPEWLGNLPQLCELAWITDGETFLPEWLSQLESLKSLELRPSDTLLSLRTTPEQLCKLEGLSLSWHLSSRSDSDHTTLPDWIGDLIALKSLSLKFLPVSEFPDSLKRLQNLVELNVVSRHLGSIQFLEWFPQLKKLIVNSANCISSIDVLSHHGELESLTLSNLNVGSLPDFLSRLNKLENLYIRNGRLGRLPEWFRGFSRLRTLSLPYNPLGEVPHCVLDLHALESLSVSACGVRELDPAIGALNGLKSLYLGQNALSTLPGSMAKLKSLTKLHLSGNAFVDVPEVVYELRALEVLDLSIKSQGSDRTNLIRSLSPRFLQLENLTEFSAADNPFETPPLDVVANGIDAIRDYFRQVEEAGTDRIYEAKLLILGEGGAGKTSLAHKLQDPSYELKEKEKSTEGIDVLRWDFSREGGGTFRVNIWDFGGQEIYKETHQFFLTKRSLYALVADNRREDTDFFYWLHLVELLSDKSPLIIVKNEKQDRHREINEKQLRGEFENLKVSLATNLADNRGLDDVVREIKHLIQALPLVGRELPKTWVRVRKALEDDPRNHITRDEFFDICQKNGFQLEKDKLQLSGYLHDLGVCLHFQDDPILKRTVILKPKWGTDAVYKVLDNKRVIGRRGRFDRGDLANIWNDPAYHGMRDELLQLMINFRLCYKIPHSADYIAPQRLSENPPDYDWDPNGNLITKFTYEFMPKGILAQFIVAMHKNIVGQKLVWKTGVVLELHGTRAEVVEHYGKREVRVRVVGSQSRDMSCVVAHELEKIHATFNRRLRYRLLIQCNCTKCHGHPEPEFFDQKILWKRLGDGRRTIECNRSYEQVDIPKLIGDSAGRMYSSGDLQTAIGVPGAPPDGPRFSGPIENLFIQQAPLSREDEDDLMAAKRKSRPADKPPRPSVWVDGSFYLLTAVVVIAAVGWLSNSAPWYAFPMALLAAIVIPPLIALPELARSGVLSGKGLLDGFKLVFAQLPLIGSLARASEKEPPTSA